MSGYVRKLQLKPGHRVLLLHAPVSFSKALAAEGVELVGEGPADAVHVFAKTGEELGERLPGALTALGEQGLLWISYPKKSSQIPTDLTRDEGWKPVRDRGLESVRSCAIDDTWSAIRFMRKAPGDPVKAQYRGAKAALEPIYERVVREATALGDDVSLVPRKTYVAFTRKKQFAVVQAASGRVELGLKLKGAPVGPRLQAAEGFGSGSITHKVSLRTPEDVDAEVKGWLRQAYEATL